MNSSFLTPEFLTFFIGMLPLSEVRGAIPFALSQGLSPLEAYLLGVGGNILPVAFLLLFFNRLSIWLKQYRLGRRILGWTKGQGRKREDLVKRYGFGGLVLLVTIPLPVTGAWTGSLVSFFLSIKTRYAFPAICIGICLAGMIVLLASWGVIKGMGILSGCSAVW